MNPWVFPDGFIGVVIAGVLLEIVVVLRANRSHPRRYEQRVPATVAHLQRATSTGKTRWYITATWSDLQTHQTHTFQSGPLTHLPPWRVGETVIVAFNPQNPQQFRIE